MKKYFKPLFKPMSIIAIFVFLIFVNNYEDEHNLANIIDPYISKGYSKLNIKSPMDYNGNNIDDYTDFVNGAKKDAKNKPRYDARYISENQGYPPDDIGVCTDVIWRAFKEAGYNLRDMMNKDIKENLSAYPRVQGKPNPNIDFRRVLNLRVFFQRNAQVLTTKLENPKDWQLGDIIVFNPKEFHIGICSDRRNEEGFPLVYHNQGQAKREEDILNKYEIAYHFRFDASKLEAGKLIKFK